MVSWEGARNPCVMHWLCDLSANERKQGSSEFASLLQKAFMQLRKNRVNTGNEQGRPRKCERMRTVEFAGRG